MYGEWIARDAIDTRHPLLDIAVKLEEIALKDDYFVERKLYPNVDFYSGLIYQAMGFPVDMFAVMREVVRNGYRLAIYPEHPRALDYDREVAAPSGGLRGYPGGGGYAGDAFNVAYTRAMLQAAVSVSSER